MISKLLNFFVNFMQKYLPDPFTIAWLITLFVLIIGSISGERTTLELINNWGSGFFGILPFAMQMTLVVVTGYALAAAPIVQRFLKRIAAIPKTPAQLILFISVVSMVLYYLNWGLGLIAGGILAREAAKLHPKVDFRLLVTAAFSGIIITHGGLSASIPLLINTKGHFLEAQIGLVPLSQTLFHPQTIFITVTLAIVIPLILVLMMPKEKDTVVADPRLLHDEAELEEESQQVKTLSEKLDTHPLFSAALVIMGALYIGQYFYGGGSLNINILIFIFLTLGVCAHGTLIKYSRSTVKGAASSAGIILQFPFYAGILGIMESSGLVQHISDLLLQFATYDSFELYSYLSSLVISVFVPSAGGHWVVQAPIMLPAAEALGVEPWKVAMGVAWGESIWNIVCPFWALPLLAIAKIKIKDLIGFSVLLFLVGNVVAITGILLFPH
ncbi:MAG: short-chain fatty acid transporter [Neisseriaceae bacterium]|nr:short-chain fatty acid transporter [Neisseriaceae bacterium]